MVYWFRMKTAKRSTRYDVKRARRALKVLQNVFAEPKMQKTVAQELNYTPGDVSKIMKSLRQAKLVQRNDEDLYHVPVESLIRKYCKKSGLFSQEEVSYLVDEISKNKELIANSDLGEIRSAGHLRLHASSLFKFLIDLGDYEGVKVDDEIVSLNEIIIRFRFALTSLSSTMMLRKIVSTILEEDDPKILDKIFNQTMMCLYQTLVNEITSLSPENKWRILIARTNEDQEEE